MCNDPTCKKCYPDGALVEDEAELQVTRRITPLPPPQSYGGGGGGGGGGGASKDDDLVMGILGFLGFVGLIIWLVAK